jgi:molybdopterin-guanine dinucleotide biosynthesis protein
MGVIMSTAIAFAGRSNSGKTTLLEKLIPEMKKRGYA